MYASSMSFFIEGKQVGKTNKGKELGSSIFFRRWKKSKN